MSYSRIGKYVNTDPANTSGHTDFLRTNARQELINVLNGSTGNLVKASTDGRLLVDVLAGAFTISNVVISPSTAIYAGTIGLTSDAAQFTAQVCNQVVIQSDPDNAVDILLGTSGSRPLQLSPGDSLPLPIANLSLVYGRAVSSTATVNWLARS